MKQRGVFSTSKKEKEKLSPLLSREGAPPPPFHRAQLPTLLSFSFLLLFDMSSPYAHHSGTGGFSGSGGTPTMKQKGGPRRAKFGGCCCAAPRGVSFCSVFFLLGVVVAPILPLPWLVKCCTAAVRTKLCLSHCARKSTSHDSGTLGRGLRETVERLSVFFCWPTSNHFFHHIATAFVSFRAARDLLSFPLPSSFSSSAVSSLLLLASPAKFAPPFP